MTAFVAEIAAPKSHNSQRTTMKFVDTRPIGCRPVARGHARRMVWGHACSSWLVAIAACSFGLAQKSYVTASATSVSEITVSAALHLRQMGLTNHAAYSNALGIVSSVHNLNHLWLAQHLSVLGKVKVR